MGSGEADRFGEVRERLLARVRDVVDAVRKAHPGWNPPPFDPYLVAKHLEVAVLPGCDLEKTDAVLLRGPEGPYIVYDETVLSAGRKRFSIAHELSHLLLDRLNIEEDLVEAMERLCDAGAAEMLMPDPWFAEALDEVGIQADAVTPLAERFRVSRQAATRRVLDHLDGPAALGSFVLAHPPSMPEEVRRTTGESCEYRVDYVSHKEGFPYLFPHGKSVVRESAIYRCSLNGHEIQATEEFRLKDASLECHLSARHVYPNGDRDEPPTVWVLFRPA